MGRKKNENTKRADTLQSLEQTALMRGLDAAYLRHQIEVYMDYYDDVCALNQRINALKTDENASIRALTDTMAEKRRVCGEMRNILTFLGLKPPEDGGGGVPVAL